MIVNLAEIIGWLLLGTVPADALWLIHKFGPKSDDTED
jgi:hypothetical protein